MLATMRLWGVARARTRGWLAWGRGRTSYLLVCLNLKLVPFNEWASRAPKLPFFSLLSALPKKKGRGQKKESRTCRLSAHLFIARDLIVHLISVVSARRKSAPRA